MKVLEGDVMIWRWLRATNERAAVVENLEKTARAESLNVFYGELGARNFFLNIFLCSVKASGPAGG